MSDSVLTPSNVASNALFMVVVAVVLAVVRPGSTLLFTDLRVSSPVGFAVLVAVGTPIGVATDYLFRRLGIRSP